MKLLKHSLFAALAAPLAAVAHPGHSVFDASARAPHSGHELEYLILVLPVAAVIALAVRASKQTRD